MAAARGLNGTASTGVLAVGARLGRGATASQWYFIGLGLLAVALIAFVHRGPVPGPPESASLERAAPAPSALDRLTTQEGLDAYGKLGLAFAPNEGQTDARVRFLAQASGASSAFTRTGALLAFGQKEKGLTLGLRFLGASATAVPEGRRQLAGKVNYLLGNDRAQWRTGLPTYAEVVYRELWPGIDLVFRGAGGTLKYEFLVRAGANVDDIRLAYRGAKGLALDKRGNLRIQTRLGALTDTRPRSYQVVGGQRVPVDSRFVLGDGGAYGLAVGNYEAARPLVIDPGLVYSTFLGGSNGDVGLGIAVDAAGNAYVTGATDSPNFPTPLGFDMGFNGGQDVFVTKLNATGTALVYSTFIGGSSHDQGFAIALDVLGNAYVTGSTGSFFDFPIQSAFQGFVYQPFYRGGATDAFVTKLSPSGTSLVFSTYAGGRGADQGLGITLDHPHDPSGGDPHVIGETRSSNLSVTTFALDTTLNGPSDAFFLRLDRFAAAAGYLTYLGGNGDDAARATTIDSVRGVYLTGGTTSAYFPTVGGSFDTSFGGVEDAFVTKLRFVGGGGGPGTDVYALAYSTFLGGGGFDRGQGIALDLGGNAYATGRTSSPDFPTPLGFDTSFGGVEDAFVTKLNATGSALVYSTYLGGTGEDGGAGIAVDAIGAASLTGRTSSPNFPTTPGAFDTSWNLGDDAFVTKLGPIGSLVYSTFLGGSTGPNGNNDRGHAIALDATGAMYVTGLANSDNFPTTPGAFDRTHNGNSDAFVAKLIPVGAPFTLTLEPPADTNEVGNPHTVTATVRDFALQPVPGVTVRFSVTGANTASGSDVTDANGQATFTYTGTVAGLDTITAFADTNNSGTQDAGEPSGVATKVWTPGAPDTLTLEPKTAMNTVGAQHCVTATVRDIFGNPVPGVTVRFSVPTAVATHATPSSGSDVTDANGDATFCFTASLPGMDVIHAFADVNNNGMQDAGEPFDDATKTWILPPSTAFCEVTVTNGGWIIADNLDRASFGGNAKVSADGSEVQGQENYQDHGPVDPMHVKSIELLATTCTTDTDPQSATIFGRATIDGSGDYMFRIDVTDGGSGGSNDSYGIILSTGYASGQQPLQGGNVNIHMS
jgi:hypothetical protein